MDPQNNQLDTSKSGCDSQPGIWHQFHRFRDKGLYISDWYMLGSAGTLRKRRTQGGSSEDFRYNQERMSKRLDC